MIVTPLARLHGRLRIAIIEETVWYLAADLLHQQGIKFRRREHQALLEGLPADVRVVKTREALALDPDALRDHGEHIVLVNRRGEKAMLDALPD